MCCVCARVFVVCVCSVLAFVVCGTRSRSGDLLSSLCHAVVLGDSVLLCRGGSGEVLTHLPVVRMWCACGVHLVCVNCGLG